MAFYYGRALTPEEKEEVEEKIQEYCPNSEKYKGKPIFYTCKINNKDGYRISDDYMHGINLLATNKEVNEQIDQLSNEEEWMFQIISVIDNNEFTKEDIKKYTALLIKAHPEIKDIDSFINKNLYL